MKVATFEAVVREWPDSAADSVRLPEKARVYVVIPGVPSAAYIGSPRLARPEQAADFEKEIVEEDLDAGL